MGKRGPPPTFCRICGDPSFGYGLCNRHYKRWRKWGDPKKLGKAPNGVPKAFVAKAAKHKGKACLMWPHAINKGYGYYRGMRAARAVCVVVYGRPPKGRYEAAHRCGNPLCVNPRHLYWATSKQNKADMIRHGRGWWQQGLPGPSLRKRK